MTALRGRLAPTRPALAPARAARIARRRLRLGLAVVAVTALAGWLSTVAINGLPWSSPYLVRLELPSGAPVLQAGDDVDIAGERVGQVQSVGLGRGGGAVATLALAGYEIGPGASARVRPRGLAGTVYVALDPGRAARPLRSGTLLDATAGVQLTDVIGGFDADARQALQQVLAGYGTGFAGRGVEAGDALAAAPSLLADAAVTLHAVNPQPGMLSGDIGDATSIARALTPAGRATLSSLTASAGAVLHAAGDQAGALASTLDALPGFEQAGAAALPGADQLLGQIRTAATELSPGIAALAAALPPLEAVERSRPAVAELAGVARTAAPTLRALTPALGDLVGPASGLTPISDPVEELARVLIPYRTELIQAPLGFTRWGNFTYDFGTGSGHRAVRFSMVLTCAHARDPYPAPGAAAKERQSCP